MKFESDETKRRAHIIKNGIDFRQAIIAFSDPARILEITHSKSDGKGPRYRCIGNDGVRIATINFTLRAGVIRFVHAGYSRKGK